MRKNVYNAFIVLMSCVLVVFVGHCFSQYMRYEMKEMLLYAAMGATSIVALLTSLVRGGKKNEAKH
jgi:hypothetical protein